MVPVAIWRDPANGRYRAMIKWLGRAQWAGGTSLDLLVYAIESAFRKLVPDFIDVEFHYIDLGWRSHPSLEEIERELGEAMAA